MGAPQFPRGSVMPMYSLRVRGEQGAGAVSDIGFYQDEGALAYARRTAGKDPIEVWRGQVLVAVVRKQGMVDKPVQVPVTEIA